MSLETQNRKLQISFEPKKQRNKAKNARKEEVTFCLKFCLYPPLFLITISCSILIHFEQFQRLHMRYLKIYKICLKCKLKIRIVEKLKLQNHTEHL
jgi:hypothetical protein